MARTSLPGIVQALAFYIEVITFTVAAVVYTLTRRPDVVYTRSLLLGTVGTLLLRCPVVQRFIVVLPAESLDKSPSVDSTGYITSSPSATGSQ
ncbi:hypothetical protein ACFQL1_07255 [Halomicroarcula sp. GCM10025709]|uniref:hypothetical protein n=1 Tax=Halomicroarcula sp. GCM10025709 TaxID=3252669 RepID=UPI003620CDAE